MNKTRLPTKSQSKELSPSFSGKEIPALTGQQRSEFDRNGFLVIENALTNDEISRYRQVIDRFDHTISENYGGVINSTARKTGELLELRKRWSQLFRQFFSVISGSLPPLVKPPLVCVAG